MANVVNTILSNSFLQEVNPSKMAVMYAYRSGYLAGLRYLVDGVQEQFTDDKDVLEDDDA